MNIMNRLDDIQDKISLLLSDLEGDELIEAINSLRQTIHGHSPFKREPVDFVRWIKQDAVMANAYNPNKVAPDEMDLLKLSIMSDGYTQPCVVWPIEDGKVEIVDGFHRSRCGKEVDAIKKRVRSHLPVAVINTDRTAKEDRIAATVRHNRARGSHGVSAMSELVLDLHRRGWADERIAKELGMSPDEVTRLKQLTGLVEAFKDAEFSEAWIES